MFNTHSVNTYTDERTRDAAVGYFEKLLIAARITEERRVDDDRAFPAAGACAVQQEVDVDVTVASEWYLAERSDQRVVAAVASRLEYDDVVVRRTEDVEDCVEAHCVL